MNNKRPSPKQLTVVDSQQITPNMQRVTLQGEAIADFPKGCEGGYIKLYFNAEGGTEIDADAVAKGQRPSLRTYTIRSISHIDKVIEVDFVRHVTDDLQCGFAARWALEAKAGDTVLVGGPGIIADIKNDSDWFFMVADMTALPALSAKVRLLPETAKGYVVIKVVEQADQQPITVPENIDVIWLTEEDSLDTVVRSLTWIEGEVSVWVACEFDSMKALRTYFRNEKDVGRDNIYISSYWKKGVSEDGHKTIKRQDAEEYSA